MLVEIQEQVNPDEWDAAVAALGGSFVQTEGYARFEASGPNSTPLFFRARDACGQSVGLATGSLTTPRRWPLARFDRRLTLPALPLAVDGTPEAQTALLAALERAVRRRGIGQIDILAYESPASAVVLEALRYRQRHRVEFRLPLTGTVDRAWARLNRIRRKQVRQAQRAGFHVASATGREAIVSIGALMASSLRRHGIEPPDVTLWATFVADDLLARGRALLLLCERAGRPAAGLIYGLFGNRAYGLVCGSSAEGRDWGAPTLLHWELIRRLTEAGYDEINLGGAGASASDGLARFKSSLGAVATPQPAGLKYLTLASRVLSVVRSRGRRAANPPAPAALPGEPTPPFSLAIEPLEAAPAPL